MHKTGCGYQEMIKRSGLTRKTSNCYLTMSGLASPLLSRNVNLMVKVSDKMPPENGKPNIRPLMRMALSEEWNMEYGRIRASLG